MENMSFLSEDLSRAISNAVRLADARGENVDIPHFMAGVSQLDGTTASDFLKKIGLTAETIIQSMPSTDNLHSSTTQFSPELKQLIDHAGQSMAADGLVKLTPEHLVATFLRECGRPGILFTGEQAPP